MYRRWGVKDTASPDLKKPAARQKPATGCVNLPAGGTSGKGFRALCLGLAAGCVDGGAEADKDHWHETEIFQNAHVKEEYDWVNGALDRLLRRHGYVRNGLFYRAVEMAPDTVFILSFWRRVRPAFPILNISDAFLARNLCGAVKW